MLSLAVHSRRAFFEGFRPGRTCLDSGFDARLDELKKASSLFRTQKSTFVQKMGNDPILDRSLQVLDLFLLPFDGPLIRMRRSQKIDELDLPRLNLLSECLEPGMELVPFYLEPAKLVGRQVELKKKRSLWTRPLNSGKRRYLVGGVCGSKNQVQGNGSNEQDRF